LFLDYIERELIPSIDSTCNTYPHRTLFGHSRGGLFALNVLVDKPILFDNYLVSDPNLTLGNLAFLKKWKGSDVNLNINRNSLFIGLADTKEGNTLEEVLNPDSNIYPHMRTIWAICEEIENNTSNDDYFDWKYYDGFGHKTIPPMVAMDGLLSVFEYHRFDKYALIYSHIDNKITYDQFKQSINDHFDIISKRFGSTVLPYEHLIFDYGGVFLKEGMADKAVDMFKWNIENFPESVQSKEKLKSINDTQHSI
jgi:pimeloyl-ACP methyl ester carboxylesterase